MGVLMTVVTVVFLILCFFLIIIILLQSDKSAGMGILGGSSQSTFGSSTADVITKITTVMVALYMAGSLGLSIMQSYRLKSLEKDLLAPEEKTSGVIEKKTETPPAEAVKGGVKAPVQK
jgi:preprotein translocase subunit SecG